MYKISIEMDIDPTKLALSEKDNSMTTVTIETNGTTKSAKLKYKYARSLVNDILYHNERNTVRLAVEDVDLEAITEILKIAGPQNKVSLHDAYLHRINDMSIIQKLIDLGADVNERTDTAYRDGILLWASRTLRYDLCRVLIKNGADLYRTDNFGHTASETAQRRGHLEMYELLKDAELKHSGG